MFNDDHRDTIRRRWLPLVTLLACVALVFAAAGSNARAANPPLTSTDLAATDIMPPPGFMPYPATTGISDTIATAVDAYDQGADQITPVPVEQTLVEQIDAPACRPLNRLLMLPWISGTGSAVPVVDRADLSVTVWPTPSIYVMRNGTLSYELRIRNYGRVAVNRAQVTLPYTTQQMTVITSQFTNPGDWVSEVTNDHVTVTLAPIAADSGRTAAIIFRVTNDLPNNSVISVRASYLWEAENGGGTWRSNWAPLLVGNGNESAPWAWLEVKPLSGSAGTTFHFYTDRFIPREGVIVWLNTPGGTQPTTLHALADDYGHACVDVNSARLRPGTYSLVLYGARSSLTAIARFYVW